MERSDNFSQEYPVTNYHIELILQSRRFGHSDFRLGENLRHVRMAYCAMMVATTRSKRSAKLHGELSGRCEEMEVGFCDEILVEGVLQF